MWLFTLENILSILQVLNVVWHLGFLSNPDAPWDGHFKWENTNHCQVFISATTDLDLKMRLPCDFGSLYIMLCDTPEMYLVCALGTRSTDLEMKAQLRSITKCTPGMEWTHQHPPVFPALFSSPPLALQLNFLVYCGAVQEWDMQTSYQTLVLISFSLWGKPYASVFSVTWFFWILEGTY